MQQARHAAGIYFENAHATTSEEKTARDAVLIFLSETALAAFTLSQVQSLLGLGQVREDRE